MAAAVGERSTRDARTGEEGEGAAVSDPVSDLLAGASSTSDLVAGASRINLHGGGCGEPTGLLHMAAKRLGLAARTTGTGDGERIGLTAR